MRRDAIQCYNLHITQHNYTMPYQLDVLYTIPLPLINRTPNLDTLTTRWNRQRTIFRGFSSLFRHRSVTSL